MTLTFKVNRSQYRTTEQGNHIKPSKVIQTSVQFCLLETVIKICVGFMHLQILFLCQQVLSDRQFNVQAESGCKVYKVDFGSEDRFPSCSCPHFQENLLPCKHFFAIMKAGKAVWEDLPCTYRESPYMCIDAFALSREVLEACLETETALISGLTETTEAEETPFEHEPSVKLELSLSTAQRNFREALKNLQDLSYLCTDVQLLTEQTQQITTLTDCLRAQCPTAAGLLVHQEPQKTACRDLPVRKKRKKAKRGNF